MRNCSGRLIGATTTGLFGPQAALIAEAFTPRLRYSGSSLGYQFASVIAGGPAPLIATADELHFLRVIVTPTLHGERRAS